MKQVFTSKLKGVATTVAMIVAVTTVAAAPVSACSTHNDHTASSNHKNVSEHKKEDHHKSVHEDHEHQSKPSVHKKKCTCTKTVKHEQPVKHEEHKDAKKCPKPTKKVVEHKDTSKQCDKKHDQKKEQKPTTPVTATSSKPTAPTKPASTGHVLAASTTVPGKGAATQLANTGANTTVAAMLALLMTASAGAVYLTGRRKSIIAE